MNKALIFNKDGSRQLVTAEEVKSGIYSRYDYEFVDPEFEFKVQFVKGSKNHGSPYFRLYYSYEDYKRLFPDRADRYAIVANMRRFEESQWHRKWKQKVSGFCEIEKCFKDNDSNKWKFADAYNPDTNTCVEFQHSYIAFDFEERNLFYSKLGINTVWLYDLPNATIRQNDCGYIEILEDNSKGFFRISEKPENLKNYPVFIQVKNSSIYRVSELFRLETESKYKSSIRYFKPTQVFNEDSFVEFLKTGNADATEYSTLDELWNPIYDWIIVEDTAEKKTIIIYADKKGNMFHSFSSGFIQYKYVTCTYKGEQIDYVLNSFKDYSLSEKKKNEPIWKLITYRELPEDSLKAETKSTP